MFTSGLTAAAVLFLKYGPYIAGIKLVTSGIDCVATYVKHRITTKG
ncbi:hypothetical protein AB4114_11195 [Paenibacillus sp. 2RAB27]